MSSEYGSLGYTAFIEFLFFSIVNNVSTFTCISYFPLQSGSTNFCLTCSSLDV